MQGGVHRPDAACSVFGTERGGIDRDCGLLQALYVQRNAVGRRVGLS
jgi:hypothetical protein